MKFYIADCCDVIYEKDLNAIKIMTQLCEKILSTQTDFDKRHLLAFQQGKMNKDIVNKCNAVVHDKCNIDIGAFLAEKVRLGKSYHQMLNELRSLNSSFCLKANFGISPGLIGAPRRMRVFEASKKVVRFTTNGLVLVKLTKCVEISEMVWGTTVSDSIVNLEKINISFNWLNRLVSF